mmetsp:Transcript_7768/g.12861  ORF Transcript_7768/g.12861 Transcript_7768/m.12861 type:complete len:220 (-) Transcript_7768:219-878(-)
MAESQRIIRISIDLPNLTTLSRLYILVDRCCLTFSGRSPLLLLLADKMHLVYKICVNFLCLFNGKGRGGVSQESCITNTSGFWVGDTIRRNKIDCWNLVLLKVNIWIQISQRAINCITRWQVILEGKGSAQVCFCTILLRFQLDLQQERWSGQGSTDLSAVLVENNSRPNTRIADLIQQRILVLDRIMEGLHPKFLETLVYVLKHRNRQLVKCIPQTSV